MSEKKTDIAVEDANEKEIAMSIARTIAARRKELNLSQRELASMCGYPQSSVNRLETGRNIPKLETLIRICNKLKLKITVAP